MGIRSLVPKAIENSARADLALLGWHKLGRDGEAVAWHRCEELPDNGLVVQIIAYTTIVRLGAELN